MHRTTSFAILCLGAACSVAVAQPDEPPGPHTVRAAGNYLVSTGGEAHLDMADDTHGALTLGHLRFTIVGDPENDTLSGTTSGDIVSTLGNNNKTVSKIQLAIQGKNVVNKDHLFLKIVTALTGTLDG